VLQSIEANADDFFHMTWRGTAFSTDSSGRIVARPLTELQFVQKIAADTGQDPGQLIFVYRPNKHDTVVANKQTGWTADILQMEYKYTEVSNGAKTRTYRQAFLYDEYHSDTLGSAFGSETLTRDSSGSIVTYNFHGSFQYTIDGVVYSGTFNTGGRVADRSGQ
jgi:hypothetical protein